MPPAQPLDRTDPAAAFIEAACVPRGGSDHASPTLDQAAAILSENPAIADESVFVAAVVGADATVRRLVEVDPHAATNVGGPYAWDPLTYLCFSRYLARDPSRSEAFVRAARVLLEHGASARTGFHDEHHQPSPTFESALYGAAGIARHLELTRLLLEHGADAHDEETPYHVPETYQNDVMKLLVESGRVDRRGMTTMLARKHDWHDHDGIAWLLAHGADPNELSAWGRRALHQALERDNRLRFVELLLGHGADPRLADAAGRSAVSVAARVGRGDVLDLFAARGFAVTLQGAEALLAACATGDEAAARAVLGGDPGLVRAIEAEDPGTVANFAGAGNTAGTALLLDLGFDPALPTSRAGARADTALHAAIWRARHETARLLIARGAPLEAKNGRGETPLAYAVRAYLRSEWMNVRSTETVEALLAAGASVAEVPRPTGSDVIDALLLREHG